MRALRIVSFAASVAVLSACQQAKPLTPADEAAIRATDSSIVAALNAGDVAAATAGYTADATVMPPNMPPAVGADAIRELWTGFAGQMAINLTMRSERIVGEGNVAYQVGSYRFIGTLNDSTHTVLPAEDGKVLQVFMRQADGSWKAVAEAWSANAPPPAPEPAPAPARRR